MCEIQPWNIKCKKCHRLTGARWDEVVKACDNLLAHRKAECLKEDKEWTASKRRSRLWDHRYDFRRCGQWHPIQDKIPRLSDHRWKACSDGCTPQGLEKEKARKKENDQRSMVRRMQARAEAPTTMATNASAYESVAQTFSTSELQASISATYQEVSPPLPAPQQSTLQLSQFQQPAYQSFQLPPLRDIWRIRASQDDTFARNQPNPPPNQLPPLRDALQMPSSQNDIFASNRLPPRREAVQAPSDRPAPRAPRIRHPLALLLPQGRFVNPDEQGWRHPRALLGRGGVWINPGEEGYEDPGPRRRTDYGGN